MVTNPLQLLTYLAGTTSNVDLGTMVVVAPWHNPVRIAEDIVMLDSLLGPDRKLMCGVGRGLGRREYAGMNVDQNEARGRFDEAIEILRQLLATGSCTFHGQHFDIDGLRLRPQPDRDMSDCLFGAGGTADTVGLIAENGINPLTVPTVSLDLALKGFRSFAKQRAAAGFDPVHTKLGLYVYCAESHEAARAGAERYLTNFADSSLRHYELSNDHFGSIKGYESYGQMSKAFQGEVNPMAKGYVDDHPWGTPAEVAESIKRLAITFGADELMLGFQVWRNADRRRRALHGALRRRSAPRARRVRPSASGGRRRRMRSVQHRRRNPPPPDQTGAHGYASHNGGRHCGP